MTVPAQYPNEAITKVRNCYITFILYSTINMTREIYFHSPSKSVNMSPSSEIQDLYVLDYSSSPLAYLPPHYSHSDRNLMSSFSAFISTVSSFQIGKEFRFLTVTFLSEWAPLIAPTSFLGRHYFDCFPVHGVTRWS